MRKVFMCEYCIAFSKDKKKIQDHELKCKYNPVNKLCYSCKHRNEGDLFIYTDEDCCTIRQDIIPSTETCESWESKISSK